MDADDPERVVVAAILRPFEKLIPRALKAVDQIAAPVRLAIGIEIKGVVVPSVTLAAKESKNWSQTNPLSL